jgi:hypothetical protein
MKAPHKRLRSLKRTNPTELRFYAQLPEGVSSTRYSRRRRSHSTPKAWSMSSSLRWSIAPAWWDPSRARSFSLLREVLDLLHDCAVSHRRALLLAGFPAKWVATASILRSREPRRRSAPAPPRTTRVCADVASTDASGVSRTPTSFVNGAATMVSTTWQCSPLR